MVDKSTCPKCERTVVEYGHEGQSASVPPFHIWVHGYDGSGFPDEYCLMYEHVYEKDVEGEGVDVALEDFY